MNSRDVKKLLFDMEKACSRIVKFTEGCTLDAFLSNEMLQSAVERQSEIIGEALNQALGLDHSLSERITDVRTIIAFRNRLIHGYASVAAEVVWGIAINDVPILHAEVRAIMSETP
ncbi:MAG TPA: HepT-like ribonuclease domain-containing protein [Anaerolineales bacterium]|nr:HepT-like ribonuclease domain-containing protein [Anaerolineales bacterium]